MQESAKKFVLRLPGPKSSYCSCERLCSGVNVDHVVPKKELKNRIKHTKRYHSAVNDPHNLYRCCVLINREKGCDLLEEKHSGNEFAGLMARAYLYMNSEYQLGFSETQLEIWKGMSVLHEPFPFERKRSLLIAAYSGNNNPFIDYYPSTLHSRYTQHI